MTEEEKNVGKSDNTFDNPDYVQTKKRLDSVGDGYDDML